MSSLTIEDPAFARRSDLDALRAVAMLLGIVLHASMSFVPSFWVVTDRQQNPAFGIVFSAIHGFRMPLFFVMSGFFSAMLLHRRGRWSLVKHRFFRVFLPLLLGMVTIVPATMWISHVAMSSASGKPGSVAAVRGGVGHLGGRRRGRPWRHRAVPGEWGCGQRPGRQIRLDAVAAGGGGGSRGGRRAAHPARRGRQRRRSGPQHAPTLRRPSWATKRSSTRSFRTARTSTRRTLAARRRWVSRPLTRGRHVSSRRCLQIELDEEGLGSRKAAIAEYLRQRGATAGRTAGVADLLMQMPLFSHLWFLWFLWWLVLGLAAVSALGARLPSIRLPGWLVLSPARYLWLVPLTMIPQWFMGAGGAYLPFGPDGSSGPLPIPHVLAYYAIFFGFGALYFGFDDRSGRVGERWWLPLSIALLVVFPLGMVLTEGWPGPLGVRPDPLPLRVLAVFLQAAYPWLMTFGLMGLFRRFCPVESPTMRYLSDSAYWLYLAHLPLVIAAQYVVRDWPLPALAKFLFIVAVVTAFLLWTYQTLVRYTWLGRFLNGPRVRPARAGAPAVVA